MKCGCLKALVQKLVKLLSNSLENGHIPEKGYKTDMLIFCLQKEALGAKVSQLEQLMKEQMPKTLDHTLLAFILLITMT